MLRPMLGAIAVLAASQAVAQPMDPAAEVLARARAAIAASQCPAAKASPAAPPARLADNTVREASYHRILVEGCGQRMQRNYLAMVMLDGTRRIVETLPGTTVTDPVLQRDAMQAATMAASAAAPGCRQVQPRAANFDGPDSEPNAPRRTRPWAELWIFDACGALLGVPMRFSPTGRGTGFTAGAPVRRLN